MVDFLWLMIAGLFLALGIPIIKTKYFQWQRARKYRSVVHNIDNLYHAIDPYQLSITARANNGALPKNLTYGEIDICALLDLLQEMKVKPHDIFYDLGSGAGKALLAVKLCYPTLEVRGIELLPSLHAAALSRYHAYLASKNIKSSDFVINYYLADFLACNFLDANIIFINATGYTEDEFKALLPKLLALKANTKIIVTSKTLPDTFFERTYQGLEKMSWGLTSTYVYQKK